MKRCRSSATHPQPQFRWHPGLALGDPLGVRLENGEDLPGMGDRLALQHPAANLVNLPVGMLQVAVERGQPQREGGQGGQLIADAAHARQAGFGLFPIAAVGLLDSPLPVLALLLVLGGGGPERLDAAAGLLEPAEQVGILPLAGQPVRVGQPGAKPQCLADGIVKQASVGGAFDIGFDYKRVGPCV